MHNYPKAIRSLPAAEKLRLVESIWDDIASSQTTLPLPDWAIQEARRRRAELIATPTAGVSHETMWQRIEDGRNG
jgi:putative addiction module component (TIGR02574 family)